MFLKLSRTENVFDPPFGNASGTLQICCKYEGVCSFIFTCDHDQVDILLSGVCYLSWGWERSDKNTVLFHNYFEVKIKVMLPRACRCLINTEDLFHISSG